MTFLKGGGGAGVNHSKQDYVTLPLAEVVTRLRSVILRKSVVPTYLAEHFLKYELKVQVYKKFKNSVCSDEGLTFETSAKHHIPQASNIPYPRLLIKPVFSVLTHAEKVFFKTNLPVFTKNSVSRHTSP